MSVLDTFHKLMLARQAGANPMSMIKCDGCGYLIDSDDDPACFVEVPWLNMTDKVWCESCREDEFDNHEQEMSIAENAAARAEKL